MSSTFALLSLPLRIFDESSPDPLAAISSTVGTENAGVGRFNIPEFKIGTLDALVQQADQLVKLEASCEGVVTKVADSLGTLCADDKQKLAQNKMINNKPAGEYMRAFSWDKVRYRAEKPIGELLEMLQSELTAVDNDSKQRFSQFQSAKNTLSALEKKRTGNLTTKSLAPLVDPSYLVQDSEYLETHLVVVPNSARKDFSRSYETLSDMVVPRSKIQVAEDDEFTLFSVTTFKKFSSEFLQKCRENKWTPRQYTYVEGGKEEEQQEYRRMQEEEAKKFGEALRFGHLGWSESVKIWVHVLTIRVFVETVLRYGLPLEFVAATLEMSPSNSKNVKTALDSAYSYLGGNAFGRDKHGRITKDDAALTSEMAAVGLGGDDEYSPYVYYELEFP
ncbi:putative vacuolar atp synthase subunit c 1 protein [Zalerion maritima]|uniref:V-type proton ATPase subunit C n=1 Tax=Zalerion maritima TaxID=339359 RepID=A0AAD5RGC8_9PEZI|nr:putative vacuolar atp synthase subunit c 1 protein [Zalerion maritima]